jgi:hypothetical protein
MPPWHIGVGCQNPSADSGASAPSSSSLSLTDGRCFIKGGDGRPASPIRPSPPFLWRLPMLVLHRSSNRSPMRSFVKSWWWSGAGVDYGEVFFNKRALLLPRMAGSCRCCFPFLMSMVEWKRVVRRRLPARREKAGEIQSILSSSTIEASSPQRSNADKAVRFQPPARRPWSGSPAGAQNPRATKWCVPRCWGVDRGCESSLKGAHEQQALVPLWLCLEDAGEVWRRCPGTILFKFVLYRVLCVKRKDLSKDRRFPRASIEKVLFANCTCHFDNRWSGIFLDHSPLFKKKNPDICGLWRWSTEYMLIHGPSHGHPHH